MKAIVITHPGSADVLQMLERPVPTPLAGEVLIKVMAAGVNRPDVAQRKGSYPAPPGTSADIPGLEVAGIIEQCGELVTRWKPGDSVCALVAGGGYAEYAIANAAHCLPVPTQWSFAEASSLPETVFTVWHNVFQRGRLQSGEHFLVHGGSSGIGITAIQLAKAFGAKVFATAGSEEKCEACILLGADKCINYKEEDFEDALKNEGVDVILDMIGGEYVPKNIRLLKPDGRLVFINAMKGAEAVFNVFDIMGRRLTITGSTLRNREVEFKAQLAVEIEKNVWPLLKSKKIKPVIYREFPLAEASSAHTLMESSKHIGKIVLSNHQL
ncbi:NAD(P)H-quinone oxidoreductase [Segetibacter koreensis]|uniref:NAD(P)H-quinone oxidoreductase n=1 Tax=Segetibacter koreensis TaxID=398037 RepID=UPI000380C371|nr:NAD(P)H-quinone oxidoreductase [Segetibacter koreensis]